MTRTHRRPWQRRIWSFVSPQAPGVRHEAPIRAVWHDANPIDAIRTTRRTPTRRGLPTPGRYPVASPQHMDGSTHPTRVKSPLTRPRLRRGREAHTRFDGRGHHTGLGVLEPEHVADLVGEDRQEVHPG